MKTLLLLARGCALLQLAWLLTAASATAQTSAFTYQGRLTDAGLPVTGNYDLQFQIFDALTAGTASGGAQTVAGQLVVNGTFTVTLDFGATPFVPGGPRWLEIGVRAGGNAGPFTLLTPRQQLTAAPFAIQAVSAGTLSALLSESLLPPAVPRLSANQTFSGAVTFNPAAPGTPPFQVGNSTLVPNLNAQLLGGLGAGSFWQLGGNAGTLAGTHFLGTTDSQALEFRVSSQRVLRMEPGVYPNLIGGWNANAAVGYGITIAGGGGNLDLEDFPNVALANFSVIGGGLGNTNRGRASTIAGGMRNTIEGSPFDDFDGSSVAGGRFNLIQIDAPESTIGGGLQNTIQRDGFASVIGGGYGNLISSNTFGAMIAGGNANRVGTNASYSVIPGGQNNKVAAAYSFAAGRRAEAIESGSFVWADATPLAFGNRPGISASNQFLIRALGGMGVNTNDPAGVALNVHGTVRAHRFEGDGSALTGVGGGLVSGATYPGNFTFPGLLTLGGATGAPFAVGSATLVPNLNAELLGGLRATNFWQIGGNAGTVAGTHFLGTTDNQPLEFKVNGTRALRLIPTATSPNVIGGFSGNAAVAGGSPGFVVAGGTVAGGGAAGAANFVGSSFSTVGGGSGNVILSEATDNLSTHNTISGGLSNRIDGDLNAYNFIGGGSSNFIGGLAVSQATIGGGSGNRINSESGRGTIAGGFYNSINGVTAAGTIGGGQGNVLQGDDHYATISGGLSNTVQFAAERSVIAGGERNVIQVSALLSVIGGGLVNAIANGASHAVIAGGDRNLIGANASRATIAGGGTNSVSAAFGTIGGGRGNFIVSADGTVAGGAGNGIADSSPGATIGGGGQNAIGNDANYATVAGGVRNSIIGLPVFAATIGGGATNEISSSSNATIAGGRNNRVDQATYATIGGGFSNLVAMEAFFSVIAGGQGNQAGPGAECAVLAGGRTNTIGNNGRHSTIGGGKGNRIGLVAEAECATIAGGLLNEILTGAFGGAIGGGYSNSVGTAANSGTVPGGSFNTAGGTNSLAAGYRAKALHSGAFVWGDRTEADVASTANNQFIARAAGGFWFGTGSAVSIGAGRLIDTSSGAFLSSGGAWTSTSDRAVKENFAAVDPRSVLDRVTQLPLQTWNYKAERPEVRHLGPTAQDFRAAFGLGEDDRHISAVDAGGVALTAIQGLHAVVQEKDARITALERDVAELRKLVETLARQQPGGAR